MHQPPDELAALNGDTTLAQARLALSALLREAGCPSPELDARVLLYAAAAVAHLDLIAAPARPLGTSVQRVRHFMERRLAGEPVARIVGTREFWSLPFVIGPAVLDPRADTETLVAAVLARVARRETDAPLRLLDLGTGSGAILCALLSERRDAWGVGVDRSPGACRLAAANCCQLGLADRAHIVCADWTAGLAGQFDVIVSNPPYIATADIADLAADVRCFDPPEALDGGVDGLVAYRALTKSVVGVAAPGAVIAFECGSTQATAVADLMREVGWAVDPVCHDLAGRERVVVATVQTWAA